MTPEQRRGRLIEYFYDLRSLYTRHEWEAFMRISHVLCVGYYLQKAFTGAGISTSRFGKHRRSFWIPHDSSGTSDDDYLNVGLN